MTEKNYSLEALEQFFDFAINKGLLKKNTAQSRKLAASKVLSVLDEQEKADLREVDIDHAFELFQNKFRADYTPDSLQVYKSRVRSALGDFVRYVDNPSGFRPSTSQRASSAKTKRENNGNGKSKETRNDDGQKTGKTHHEDPPSYGIIVPVPLREGLVVKISNVPSDLTPAEANRLAAIIKAYAMTEE